MLARRAGEDHLLERILRLNPLLLAAVFVAASLAGLYFFRGVPVVSVALGFPLGWYIALRARAARGGAARGGAAQGAAAYGDDLSFSAQEHSLLTPGLLRTILTWSLFGAAITFLLGWAEVVTSLLWGLLSDSQAGLTPIAPLGPSTVDLFGMTLLRARLWFFAVLLAPELQILTTLSGAFVTLAFVRGKGSEEKSSEG